MHATDHANPGILPAIRPEEFAADPLACLARHRKAGWWAPLATGGGLEVLDYSAVRELMGRDREFGACLGDFFDALMRQNPQIAPELSDAMRETSAKALINLDGEVHQRLRALVGRHFTHRSVARLRERINEVAGRLAREMEPGGDFMRTFARQLPAIALCELTGIPREDHALFASWIDVLEVQLDAPRLAKLGHAESLQVLEVHEKLRAYCIDLVRVRRESPRDDLVSRMAAESSNDGEFDEATIAGLIADLIFAGNDTTRNALGLMMMALANEPGAWEQVASNPEFAGHVVEEVLRLHSPAPGPVRCTREAVEVRDRPFEPGEVLILSIWSANHDPAFWGDDVEEFRPGRERGGEHLTFGHGPHFCLGAGLAREELRAALVALTRELTAIEILEPPPMREPGSIYGPIELKVGFQRRAAR